MCSLFSSLPPSSFANLATLPVFAVTTPGTLTVSGKEMTDASRTAAIQGDGRTPPDSSVRIWEVTTNLVTNGGFETNATGWVTTGATLATSAEQAKFGMRHETYRVHDRECNVQRVPFEQSLTELE